MTNNVILSISGIYQLAPDIFDDIELPAGADLELLKQNILINLDNLEILYPNPTYLKWAIGTWAATRKHAWERLWGIQAAEYNPLHNYDRTETGHSNSSGSGSSSGQSSGSSSGTASVAAFNATDTYPFKDTNKNAGESSGTDSGTSEASSTGEYENHMEGNIGVTTSQQMANDELQLWQWDFYRALTDEFAKEFCIGVY